MLFAIYSILVVFMLTAIIVLARDNRKYRKLISRYEFTRFASLSGCDTNYYYTVLPPGRWVLFVWRDKFIRKDIEEVIGNKRGIDLWVLNPPDERSIEGQIIEDYYERMD